VEIVLVGAVATVAVLKLFERRTPNAVYRAVLVIGITLPLAATLWAIALLWNELIGWRELSLFAAMYLATGLGTTLGYHRLIAHESFEAHPAVKAVALALGGMAVQGRITNWVAFHRAHHAHADCDGDPHSPLEGFFHAHVGWLLRAPEPDRERYAKRLLNDRVVVFFDRTAELWAVAGLVIPYAVAGWEGLLWGGLVRIAFGNQMTFAINSVCHMFGRRSFDTRDESRNNWFMGAVGLGEGWHNNHHAFPAAAFHGMGWRQPDVTALVIRLLERAGLVWNVRRPSPASVERRREVLA
jgi:stearoyl-CoA desaturase (delta-9 desaturase)